MVPNSADRCHLNKRQKGWLYLPFCAFLVLMILTPWKIVNGQNPTNLAVIPTSSNVVTNNTINSQLYITSGNNINAFDVIVTYDSTILTLQSWSHGGYLSNLMNVVVSNTPGRLQVVATQIATPGVTGDGILLNLVFRGSANGISPVTISKAELATSQNIKVFPSLQHGSILVHSDPATTPSRTVTGSFTLQGQINAAGIPVEFGYGQTHWLGPYSGTTSALSPNFSLANVAEDTYPVTISLPRYLDLPEYLSKKFTVSGSSTVMPPLLLHGGNAVWQDCVADVCVPNTIIDAADVSLVGAQYLQSGPDLDGDVNYSGRVDIFDLAMVGANYGLTSKDVYATWLP